MTETTQIGLTPIQASEIDLFKRFLNTILADRDYEHWNQLTNEDRKSVITEINTLVNTVMPEEERFYSLVYTLKDGNVELMALPKTESAKYQAQAS